MNRKNIVLMAAHPDDIAMSMGGTAWLLKDRYQLHVICLSKGERGLKGTPMDQTAAIREKEEQGACDLLGATLTFGGQIDGEIYPDRSLCERVAEMLKKLEPVALFTMWGVEVPDHEAAHMTARRALQLAGMKDAIEEYMYEAGPGGQTNMFDPDLYVNISDVAEEKKRLIRCHACQVSEAGVERWMRLDAFRGRLARCEYAEGFKVTNPLINKRWGRKVGYLLLDL